MSGPKRSIVKKTAQTKKSKTPLVVVSIAGAAMIVLALVFVLQKPAPASNSTQTNGNPALVADTTMIDLGDVSIGTTVEAAFELTNTGSQPLEFTSAPYIEVKEGC